MEWEMAHADFYPYSLYFQMTRSCSQKITNAD